MERAFSLPQELLTRPSQSRDERDPADP
jgi:hypothetical protein